MANNILQEIKSDLDSWVGKKVRLKANKGRRKVLQKDGILEKTYPNIFVVMVDEEEYPRRLSFSYADILTETVEIMVPEQKIRIGCVNV